MQVNSYANISVMDKKREIKPEGEAFAQHLARWVAAAAYPEKRSNAAFARALALKNAQNIQHWKARGVSARKSKAAAALLGCPEHEIRTTDDEGLPASSPATELTVISDRKDADLLRAAMNELANAPPDKVRAVMAILLGAPITAPQQAPPETSIFSVVEAHGMDEKEFFSEIRSVIRDEVKSAIIDLDEKREERRLKDLGKSPKGEKRRATDKQQ